MSGDTDWKDFPADNIPSSLELFPELFDFISMQSRILDLGCGPGKTLRSLVEKGFKNVYGADVNSDAISKVRDRFKDIFPDRSDSEKRFKASGGSTIPFPDEYFDCVICQAVWTIVPAKVRPLLMSDIFRIMKPDGILYILDFTRTPEIPLYKDRYNKGRISGLEDGSFEVFPEDSLPPYIAHHYTIEEIENLISSASFQPVLSKSPKVKTRSGNIINGILVIARKSI